MNDPVKAIEFVGAPGSGKTTLVKWLAGRASGSGGSRRWLIPASELLVPFRGEAIGLGRIANGPSVRAAAARRPLLRRILMGRRAGYPREPRPETERLLGLVREVTVLGPRGAVHYREEALGWLSVTLKLMEAAREASDRVVPMLDEGIVQRSLSVLGPRPEAAALEAVLSLLPRSTLVVHLRVPDEVLVARAVRRSRTGDAPLLHQGLTEQEIAELVVDDASELALRVETLEAKGWETLRLDAFRVGRPSEVGRLGGEILAVVAGSS